ncbi:MAG TPA: hypothetical protein PKI61_01660 [bacterium]|nr:hypothetical protein [bacterium]HPT30165.1 hypothetical protein [bacterium]
MEEKRVSVLHKCSLGNLNIMTIDAVDGRAIINDSPRTFKSFLHEKEFRRLGLNKPSVPTEQIDVIGRDLIRNATSIEIFNSFVDLDKACVTQAQIVKFCQMHSWRLDQDGRANLFLTKEQDEYFVIDVSVDSDGLEATPYPLSRKNFVWTIGVGNVFAPVDCLLVS